MHATKPSVRLTSGHEVSESGLTKRKPEQGDRPLLIEFPHIKPPRTGCVANFAPTCQFECISGSAR